MDMKAKNSQKENRFSSLINLIKRESIEEVREVVQKWPSLLNMKDQSSRTALHYCSEHSSALCADLILEKCPNLLTTADNDGYTALILSVICGNQVMTRYLIGKSDANYVNECDFERHSSVHWATVSGQLECLHLLLSSGAHSSRADIHGAYPLHYSAQMCSPSSGICVGNDTTIGLALLNRLLQCPDVDVDCVDSDSRTPLLWAASAGSADAILALVNAGARTSAKDKDGLTALHCASSRGHIDCVETLVTLGADINQMDANGCPPLFYAVTLGHADCTRLLVESGAEVNVQDFKGRTAAHCGAARGQFETIKILGQLGANLWLRNSRGDLPLHEAVKSGRKDQVPTGVNATNNYGRSPLHIAAINNNIEMCKILIDIGADVNTVMKLKGHFITPLDAALQKAYRSVAKYLLLHGALPASRVSNSLHTKPTTQRHPSGRPLETALDNNSPIESYEEWKAREDSIDGVLQSESRSRPNDNGRTQLPKLPTLIKNSSDDQQILETSSSTPSSMMENGNHYKNVRQFETPINKQSNLKQAIITNVYVTNTPICHSKRVPPLKKSKKRRKTIQENEDSRALRVYTPSMSSSSSVINGEDGVRVVMETKDEMGYGLEREIPKENDHGKDSEQVEINNNNIEYEYESGEHMKLKTDALGDNVIDNENAVVSEDKMVNGHLEVSEQVVRTNKIDAKPNKIETKIKEREKPKSDIETETVKTYDKRDESSKKSVTSKGSVRTASSEKSSDGSHARRRSVSQRRGSVIDNGNTITANKRDNSRQRSLSRSRDPSDQKSSGKMAAKTQNGSDNKSSDNSENGKRQRARARRDFSDKMSKITEKSDETNIKTEIFSDEKPIDDMRVETNAEKMDKDIDSSTSIKSVNGSTKSESNTKDIDSVKSNLVENQSKDNELGASQDNIINENRLKDEQDEILQGKAKKKTEHDNEYSDQWENDSDKTVIDSQSRRRSTVDDIESLELQQSQESSGESKGKIIDRMERDIAIESRTLAKAKRNSSSSIASKASNTSNNKNKINNNKNINRDKMENSGKVMNNKSVKQSDKKIEKKPSVVNKTPKATEKSTNARTKRSVENNNTKANDTKPSKAAEKPKTGGKSVTLNNSLDNKSHLSVSDMSLNKSTEDRNQLICSPLKNSVSNQDINQINYNEDRPLTNLSSEESIFDSALVMADMDRSDSQMYAIDNAHIKRDLFVSPLDRNQREDVSPTRGQTEYCTEHCKKSESRCGHKYHFKTMPAHLGKVDVTHIGSRVDSRRDQRCGDSVQKYRRDRVCRVRVRPTSDGFTSIDPNIITQTVEKSLRKYQLERKLFEELHELKRFQIRSGKTNEILMVKRLVDRFRRDVKAPGMTDFDGPYTYKTYELYLYDQLRRLSWSNQGKVALLTRSASHENISQNLIIDSNENITQSNPEIAQNREDLDINDSKCHRTDETNEKRISYESQELSQQQISESISQTQNRFTSDINVTEKKITTELSQSIDKESQEQRFDDHLGNDRQLVSNFDNESQIDVTNSELKLLEQRVCETTITSDTTHYQKRELNDCNEDVSHRTEPEFENLKLKSPPIDSTSIADPNNDIEEPMIDTKPRYSIVEKIEDITDSIINEAIIEQKQIESDKNQTKHKPVQKTLSKTSLVSNESKTDQISDANSTVGSLRSRNFGKRSVDSNYSRKSSSKSVKSTNNPVIDKRKAKHIHKKECLKPVSDVRPLDSAVNRKQFKRLRTRIPAKTVINIPLADIKKRWNDIKESEMKKVFLFSEYKRQELTSGYILWYELNKNFKVRNKSIDCQIDRYIVENRKSLHRTLSDSYLSRFEHQFVKQ